MAYGYEHDTDEYWYKQMTWNHDLKNTLPVVDSMELEEKYGYLHLMFNEHSETGEIYIQSADGVPTGIQNVSLDFIVLHNDYRIDIDLWNASLRLGSIRLHIVGYDPQLRHVNCKLFEDDIQTVKAIIDSEKGI